jgi:hypothetical protein
MVQIVSGDRAGADDLAEIVDPIRNAVMAARPDAEVDGLAVAPEDRMGVDVGEPRTRDIGRIIHRRRLAEKNPDGIASCWITGVLSDSSRRIPDDRIQVALAGNETLVIDRTGFGLPLDRSTRRGLSFLPQDGVQK